MGLTFQQKFYQVPDEVFLVMSYRGTPVAIIEKPEDELEAHKLKTSMELSDSDIVVRTLQFDECIRMGYKFLDIVPNDLNKYRVDNNES